ncbi:bacteriocin-like protein [Chryseobacterium sp. MIQD13]|uniref:bacteriocin-like protein n=1 Tax=Chryseobacterium sp. MIQD13 TaxID=3422310 RepID=UPI003D27B47C
MKNLKKLSRNELKTVAGAGGIIGEPVYGACIRGYTWCPNKQKCVLGTNCNLEEAGTGNGGL